MNKDTQSLIKKAVIIAIIIVAGWFVVKHVKRYMMLYMGAQVAKKAVSGARGRIER